MVARIPEAALVAVGEWRVGFEVGAGQVVEQHVEAGIEQVTPALLQMPEQRILMGQQAIMAGVELVDLRQIGARAQQIGERGAVEPLPVEPPLAARQDEPVCRQHKQHLVPACALAAGRQTQAPEPIELQFLPQMQGQPAGAPLPGAAQLELGQPQPDDGGVRRQSLDTILREQGQRARLWRALLQHRDRLAPGGFLAVVDLAEVKQRALHHPPARHAPVFHHAPVAMPLAVLLPNRRAQEHDGR